MERCTVIANLLQDRILMQMPANDETPVDNNEALLRAEIADLKRKLEQQRRGGHDSKRAQRKRPSATTLWILAIATALLLAVAFVAGYLPETNRQTALAKEAQADSQALPP